MVRHLNASKLHLNKRSTQVLSNVFVDAVSNINNWQFFLHSLVSNNINNRNASDYDYHKAKFNVGAVTASNLNAIRKCSINILIIGQLNINSVRNRSESLVQQVMWNIDILVVSETKLGTSFPVTQFLIDGYTPPFRLDHNNNGGSIILFVRENIPCKLLSVENHHMEGFDVEVNLRKTKWLFCCSYNPNRCRIDFHLENLKWSLALYSSH